MALLTRPPQAGLLSSDPMRRWGFALFLGICAFCGGTYNGKVTALLVLIPVASIYLMYVLAVARSAELSVLRLPIGALLIWSACIVIQLIPLPPTLWFGLPGHSQFREGLALAQVDQAWRPISLAPDSTWSALIALIPIAGAIVGGGTLSQSNRRQIPLALVVIALCSAVFGIAQMTIDPFGMHLVYPVDNAGLPIGFFTNRNHQALLFAIAIPSLRAWQLMQDPDSFYAGQPWLVMTLAGFFVVMTLATGSRSGILLVAIACAMTHFTLLGPKIRLNARTRIAAAAVGFVAVLSVSGYFVAQGRADGIGRLLGPIDFAQEERLRAIPVILKMARDFFPFGTGFGTFEQAYAIYEPGWSLQLTYLNQAHNEYLDLAMTGGLPALLVAGAFLMWWLKSGRRIFQRGGAMSDAVLLARLGWVAVLLILLASITDYPLRTPMMGVVFALSCVLLALGSRLQPPLGEVENVPR